MSVREIKEAEWDELVLSKDNVVAADFWATWCGPCLMAMPALQEVYDDFEGRGVEFLAVNFGEDPERARRFIERKNYTFRVVLDPDQAIGKRFGVSAIPVLVVVGVDGRMINQSRCSTSLLPPGQ